MRLTCATRSTRNGSMRRAPGSTRAIPSTARVVLERSTACCPCSSSDASRARLVLDAALDDRAYGGSFGPAGVHRDEPSFEAGTYWRGPAWPQLSYLLWVAARRHGLYAHAFELATRTVAGAFTSGLAEYWNPDTGAALGAIPQSWTGLALVMARAEGLSASRG